VHWDARDWDARCSVLKITINRKSTKSTRSHDTHVEVGANRRGEYDVPAISVEGRWE